MNVWVEAARPKTLSAGVIPVLVGTASVAHTEFIVWRLVAALVVAVAVQVAVNYANDYFDASKGVDTVDRVGPRRAVGSGLIPSHQMRWAMTVAFIVAAIAGIAVSAPTGWWLIGLGALCFAAAVAYSGGPRPYASAGLGELFVFVFFGLVATIFSAYVQTGSFSLVPIAAAMPVGLLSVAILEANNLRDLPTDSAAGKRTLAVRLGDRTTRRMYALIIWAVFLFIPLVAFAAASLWPLVVLLTIPLAVQPMRTVARGAAGRQLIPVLAGTARLQLAFGFLLAVGLLL